eukprot:gene35020-43181_t
MDEIAASSQTARDESLVVAFKQLMIEHMDLLPGLRDLSLAASCLFGVQPGSVLLEKEYVTELMLRYMARAGTSSQHIHGAVGTEWCIVNKLWYDSWRVFVGHSHSDNASSSRSFSAKGSGKIFPNGSSSPAVLSAANISTLRPSPLRRPPPKPIAIDNWSILRKSGARGQLLQGVSEGHDFCVVAPTVYSALYAWYGGGPKIVRKVIANRGVTQIEFFPLSLKIVTCDANGRTNSLNVQESLFSKAMTVAEMISELCASKPQVTADQVRLWNYARDSWREQSVLSPELTLLECNIQDGQSILMEISLPNGTWPRSHLHATLEAQEKKLTESTSNTDDSTHDLKTVDSAGNASQQLTTLNKKHTQAIAMQTRKSRIGRGVVGLDNLGNTCYLNSSLQALLHIDHLVDYFLSQSYLRDINVKNIHGFKGKLAQSFGRLVGDLYSAENKSAISPRQLFQTIAHLREQFAGNEQHDAHELLAFLLDGLSEDLNLVHNKPYIEQPDSEGRDESELADIWWRNHLLRDHSIVQSLFTGQFQSIMSCPCGYTSARYEPFTCLTVPIPESTQRVLTVLVVPLDISKVTRVAVNVKKNGCLEDVLLKVKELTFESFILGENSMFLAGELVHNRMTKFNSFDRDLSVFSENEVVALYQVDKMPGFYGDHAPGEEVVSPSVDPDGDSDDEEDSLTPNNNKSIKTNNISSNNLTCDARAAIRSAPRYKESHWIRVAFTQCSARLIEGNLLGSAGFDAFIPEVIGVTLLEVLPADIIASDLYAMIAARVSPFMKATVSSLLTRSGTATPPASPARPTPCTIHTMPSDEVFGSEVIPQHGFTLRCITKSNACSRCHWLERCQGCVVPNNKDVTLKLSDGECLAIDWHFVVLELVDTNAVVGIEEHSSVMTENESSSEHKIPLSRCLDKFTEKEPLDDVVCPKCRNADGSVMSKSLTIWRQPPVLIVQIKRFQFDRTARRKLNNRIDFPLEGLNVSGHMCKARTAAKEMTNRKNTTVELIPDDVN